MSRFPWIAGLPLTFCLLLASAHSQQPGGDWTKPADKVYSIQGVAFSPDGQLLAAASGVRKTKGKVIVWNLADTTKTQLVHEIAVGASSVAFSSDSKTIAAGSYSGDCHIVDLAAGRGRAVFGSHGTGCWSVAFSPDGKTLAVASDDTTIHLWDYKGGNELVTLAGHSKTVFCADFAADGKTMISSAEDDTVRLWDPEKGTLLKTWANPCRYAYAVRFDPQSRRAVVASWTDQRLVILSRDGGKNQIAIAGGGPEWMAMHPQGKAVALSNWSGSDVLVLALDLRQATASEAKIIEAHIALWQSDSYETREKASRDVEKLGWIAEPFLANAVNDSPLAETRMRARQARVALRNPAERAMVLRGHQTVILCGAFSPDGNTLATAGRDGNVILWDWANGKMITKLACP
jgi:WD40 repeat protein